MKTKYGVVICGGPNPLRPAMHVGGDVVQNGDQVKVDVPTAFSLLNAGAAALADPDQKIALNVCEPAAMRTGILIDGRCCVDGDSADVDWPTAKDLIWRGRARLADGVTLPSRDPDRRDDL